jgi:DNA polymerase-3 subunit alpha (Gram-positive type)
MEIIDEIKNTVFSVVDIETTGLFPESGDRVCEIGIVKIKNGVIMDTFSTLVNPQKAIPAEVSRINKITDHMVANSPVFSDITGIIRDFMVNTVIVCHNAEFDIRFLKFQFGELGESSKFLDPVIDTLALARKCFNFPGNSLKKIMDYLDIESQELHRAINDAQITAQIFLYMISKLAATRDVRTISEVLKAQYGLPGQGQE